MDAPVQAVVQVDGAETAYTSHGRGRPAIVVGTSEEDRRRLADPLVGDYRVIEPVLPTFAGPAEEVEFRLGQWLLGVMEGLGLDAPLVLLAPGLAPLAAPLAAMLAGTEAVVLVGGWQDH